jgi:hypothetical protein
MPLFARRPTLPADVRDALDLRPGDRVLTAAAVPGDRWLVASRRALHLTGPDGVVRRPWSDVDRASFAPEPAAITVHWIAGTTEVVPLVPPPSAAFAQTFRERVQSSVVHAETVALPGDRGQVRVALRRGEEGDLFTQVIGPGTIDLADPDVVTTIEAAEGRVRAAAGA